MITVNAIGDTCPIPVVKTKKAIEALTQPDTVETLVDNEVAVENYLCRADTMKSAVSVYLTVCPAGLHICLLRGLYTICVFNYLITL